MLNLFVGVFNYVPPAMQQSSVVTCYRLRQNFYFHFEAFGKYIFENWIKVCPKSTVTGEHAEETSESSYSSNGGKSVHA